MQERETCKNARNECVIHVTFRGASPKLDYWWGLGMYPIDAMYAAYFPVLSAPCWWEWQVVHLAAYAAVWCCRCVCWGWSGYLVLFVQGRRSEGSDSRSLEWDHDSFGQSMNAEQQRVEEFLLNSSYHSPSPSSLAAAIQSCLHSAKMMLPHPATGCTGPSWVDIQRKTQQHMQFEPKFLHSHEKHGEEVEACSLQHSATCSVSSSLTCYSFTRLPRVAAQWLDSGNYTNNSPG